MKGSTAWARTATSLLIGCLAWLVGLAGQTALPEGEVFAWVADRDADCVVALDQDLFELEAWVVPRPTALVRVDAGVVVKGSRGLSEEDWWLLRRGARPVLCSAPEEGGESQMGPAPLPSSVQGTPTAWLRAGSASLVATPGALHLLSEHGALERVQGGFRWISDFAVSADSSP